MCIGGKSHVYTHHFIIMLHVCVAVGHTNVYFLQMRTLFHITNYILHCQFSNKCRSAQYMYQQDCSVMFSDQYKGVQDFRQF